MRVIWIEGIDGSGKTTTVRLLSLLLQKKGYNVLTLHFYSLVPCKIIKGTIKEGDSILRSLVKVLPYQLRVFGTLIFSTMIYMLLRIISFLCHSYILVDRGPISLFLSLVGSVRDSVSVKLLPRLGRFFLLVICQQSIAKRLHQLCDMRKGTEYFIMLQREYLKFFMCKHDVLVNSGDKPLNIAKIIFQRMNLTK